MRSSMEHLVQQEIAAEELPDREKHPERFTLRVAEELAAEVRARFSEAFRKALVDAPHLSDGMKQYILSKDLDVPVIEILADSKERTERLDEVGYGEAADMMWKDEVLFIIHLPNIMRSPTYTKTFRSEDPIPDNLIKGIDQLYRSVVDPIWEAAGDFSEEHGIHIERINPVGIHDNRKPGEGYYYLWRISPASSWS